MVVGIGRSRRWSVVVEHVMTVFSLSGSATSRERLKYPRSGCKGETKFGDEGQRILNNVRASREL